MTQLCDSTSVRRRLGVPYQGSKNQIAREIISVLPRGKRFVDLFAGGCAMTHAAILSGKYDTFLANDQHGFGVRLFVDALNGKTDGRWREWVSRDEFMRRKETDPLVALCWSFANSMRTYLFGKGIEREKRLVHETIVQAGSYEQWLRSRAKDANVCGFVRQQAVERIDSLSSVSGLLSFVNPSSISTTFSDYRDYVREDGDVVYCDPPYANTGGYCGNDFDSAEFWHWADSQPYPVFVSEYAAPCGFTPVWTKGKQRMFCMKSRDSALAERVFVADRFAAQFQSDLFLCL